MPNLVLETESFSKLFDSLEQGEKEWIRKIIHQLEDNLQVGKPLRFDWFREKKYEGKRLYYLVSERNRKVLLVAFGDKKEQDKIIQHVLQNREEYLRVLDSTPSAD